MSIENRGLFEVQQPAEVGVGFHNVGSGVLRASRPQVMQMVEFQYGERCGHLPLAARQARVLVSEQTPDLRAQLAYLSQLYGKEIRPITAAALAHADVLDARGKPLVVPYINVPETQARIEDELGARSWGLPGQMVTLLKNKVDFYRLIDEFAYAGFATPDYVIARIGSLSQEGWSFLGEVEDIVKAAGLARYPIGLMMRAAESDGNYGCCLLYEQAERVVVVRDGEADQAVSYDDWRQALAVAQGHLAATMNEGREARVVISRFLDLADSPGMSVVIMDGEVASLRWNGQLQKKGSKACIGTSSYTPKNAYVARLQQEHEERTAVFFEALLRETARRCGIDFASLRGVANIDLMLPGPLEVKLRELRGQRSSHYLAECNPRWTNYTDAILTIIGANRGEQCIKNMRAVIQRGIYTIDKYHLPANVDPRIVREFLAERDQVLSREGSRIVCRMAKHPMGLIFAGDVLRGQEEVASVVRRIGGEADLAETL
jgi:hypothetical protein